MEQFDITKVDIFSLQNMNNREMCYIHSLLMFLYSKYHGNDEINFKYSEIGWIDYNYVNKMLKKLSEMGVIEILKRPTKQRPFTIKIKSNNELHYVLNKNKKLEFEKYQHLYFTRKHLQEALGCSSLKEHFIGPTVHSWLRNVANEKWNIYKFLFVTKIVSHFSCDYKIKTFTVNKYVSKKASFKSTLKFLYEKVPDNRKEIVFTQFENTVKYLKLHNDKSFTGMALEYYFYLNKK